jgi:hypothetical protein
MQRMNPVFEENLRRTQNLGQKVAILCETSQSIQDELLKQRSAALRRCSSFGRLHAHLCCHVGRWTLHNVCKLRQAHGNLDLLVSQVWTPYCEPG